MNQKLGKRKRRQLAADKGLGEPPKIFFHGGNEGLKVGDYILPPETTGVSPNGYVPSHIRRKDRIFIVKNFVQAAPWAAQHPHPVIYEVEAEGKIEDDPDNKKPGTSFQCPKAKIIAIHTVPADMLHAARKLLLQ